MKHLVVLAAGGALYFAAANGAAAAPSGRYVTDIEASVVATSQAGMDGERLRESMAMSRQMNILTAYEFEGTTLRVTRDVPVPRSVVMTCRWSANGQAIKVTACVLADGTAREFSASLTYDASGNIIRATSPEGGQPITVFALE